MPAVFEAEIGEPGILQGGAFPRRFSFARVSLKPNDLVHATMTADMAGAAAVLASMSALGVGVAEAAGLVGALIRKLVNVAPRKALGFIVVVAVLDLIMTGSIPKWAPVFMPLLMRLGVEPKAVLAAYPIGDSPLNAVSPLNAYFALIASFAAKYQKDVGAGTVVALMLPYVVVLFVVWPLLLDAWQLFGLPWGLE